MSTRGKNGLKIKAAAIPNYYRNDVTDSRNNFPSRRPIRPFPPPHKAQRSRSRTREILSYPLSSTSSLVRRLTYSPLSPIIVPLTLHGILPGQKRISQTPRQIRRRRRTAIPIQTHPRVPSWLERSRFLPRGRTLARRLRSCGFIGSTPIRTTWRRRRSAWCGGRSWSLRFDVGGGDPSLASRGLCEPPTCGTS
jgi:hypothetical protein